MNRTWALIRRYRAVSLGAVAILLAVVEAFIDFETWIQLNVSIVYTLPLVVAAAARSRRLLWALVPPLVCATFIAYSLQISPGAFALTEPYFINRVLAAVTLLLTAGLLHAWLVAVDALDARNKLLNGRNAELEAANRELVVRDEQIARQNEELELRRRAAEEASGRKSQLLASVSHDLRTPINAINLLAEIIGRTAGNPALAEQVPGTAQRIQANVRSVADLLSSLLDSARIESGRTQTPPTVFSLNELLIEQCRDLLPLAQAKQLRLEVDVPPSAIWLRSDRVALSRVIANLVGNAIKFTNEGAIAVSAWLNDTREPLISVRDTGVGIAAEQSQAVFAEFTQLANGEAAGRSGWGLGLAICSRLVDAMGGTISLESRPGVGSTFTVRLPSSCLAEPVDTVSPRSV